MYDAGPHAFVSVGITGNTVTSPGSAVVVADGSDIVFSGSSYVCNNAGPSCIVDFSCPFAGTTSGLGHGCSPPPACSHGTSVCSAASPNAVCYTCHSGWAGTACTERVACASPDVVPAKGQEKSKMHDLYC